MAVYADACVGIAAMAHPFAECSRCIIAKSLRGLRPSMIHRIFGTRMPFVALFAAFIEFNLRQAKLNQGNVYCIFCHAASIVVNCLAFLVCRVSLGTLLNLPCEIPPQEYTLLKRHKLRHKELLWKHI